MIGDSLMGHQVAPHEQMIRPGPHVPFAGKIVPGEHHRRCLDPCAAGRAHQVHVISVKPGRAGHDQVGLIAFEQFIPLRAGKCDGLAGLVGAA